MHIIYFPLIKMDNKLWWILWPWYDNVITLCPTYHYVFVMEKLWKLIYPSIV